MVSYGECWNGGTLGYVNTVECMMPAVGPSARRTRILSRVLVEQVDTQQHDGWRAAVRCFVMRNGRADACCEGHSFTFFISV